MERIDDAMDFAIRLGKAKSTRERFQLITARDAAIRAQAAEDAVKWFEARRKERHESGNDSAIHASIRAAICRKEVVG